MSLNNKNCLLLFSCLLGWAPLLAALESDRQQPLEVNADSTAGLLGDGTTVLSGNVVVKQGTLHIRADQAEVEKVDGKVRTVVLQGGPAFMAQEIEGQGKVEARARTITYQVSTGKVTMTGDADVQHPQYQVSGDTLTYDLNRQHFEGTGEQDGSGRIRIRLDPEVLPEEQAEDAPPAEAEDDAATENQDPDAPDG